VRVEFHRGRGADAGAGRGAGRPGARRGNSAKQGLGQRVNKEEDAAEGRQPRGRRDWNDDVKVDGKGLFGDPPPIARASGKTPSRREPRTRGKLGTRAGASRGRTRSGKPRSQRAQVRLQERGRAPAHRDGRSGPHPAASMCQLQVDTNPLPLPDHRVIGPSSPRLISLSNALGSPAVAGAHGEEEIGLPFEVNTLGASLPHWDKYPEAEASLSSGARPERPDAKGPQDEWSAETDPVLVEIAEPVDSSHFGSHSPSPRRNATRKNIVPGGPTGRQRLNSPRARSPPITRPQERFASRGWARPAEIRVPDGSGGGSGSGGGGGGGGGGGCSGASGRTGSTGLRSKVGPAEGDIRAAVAPIVENLVPDIVRKLVSGPAAQAEATGYPRRTQSASPRLVAVETELDRLASREAQLRAKWAHLGTVAPGPAGPTTWPPHEPSSGREAHDQAQGKGPAATPLATTTRVVGPKGSIWQPRSTSPRKSPAEDPEVRLAILENRHRFLQHRAYAEAALHNTGLSQRQIIESLADIWCERLIGEVVSELGESCDAVADALFETV